MPITIIVADDQKKAHSHAVEALPKSRCATWQLAKINCTKPESQLTLWMNSASNLSGDVALILDLGFRGTHEALWPTVKSVFLSAPQNAFASQLPESLLDGLAAAIAVVNNAKVERLLVYVASTLYNKSDEKVIRSLLSTVIAQLHKSSTHKVAFGHNLLADSPEEARCALDALAESWIENFPDLHSHPITSAFLRVFLSPYIEGITCPERRWAWCHDCLDSSSTDFFLRLADVLPNLKNSPDPTQSAKSLLMVGTDVSTTIPKWKEVWAMLGQSQTRPLQAVVLGELLTKLCIPRVGILDGATWEMPVVPAMPFILSLSHLVRKFEEGGSTPSMVWEQQSGRSSLSLWTNKKYQKDGVQRTVEPRDLENAYKRKLASGCLDGVCGALHRVLHCRLGGLNEVMPMLGLFAGKGIDEQVVDLDFQDYGFKLSWPIKH